MLAALISIRQHQTQTWRVVFRSTSHTAERLTWKHYLFPFGDPEFPSNKNKVVNCMTNRSYWKISISQKKTLVKVDGNLRGVKNRTKGHTVRPNLKPHGQRWPAQCPLCPGPPRTSEHVYTPRVYYNHLLQEKQAPFLWAHSQEKATSASLLQGGRYSDDSLPQPQNPTTRWLRENERKMTGDKLWGGKRFIFSLNQMKG